MTLTRREWLKRSSLLAALATTGISTDAASRKNLKIAACDWSLGKGSDPGSFAIARSIGLEGVQVNMGSTENDLHLRRADVQQQFITASKAADIPITSLAIAELNRVPYKSDPRTEKWVSDSIDVAKACGVSVVLLAFFDKDDLRNDAAGITEVVRRLKAVAPKAEKNGVILGIESYLNAAEHLDIMDRVGSDNVKVYYDFRNTADAGYDPVRELKILGKDRICELHMKENGVLLGNGTLDWKKICEALIQMDYIGDGWMQIEWAMPSDGDVVRSYKHNLNFLKEKLGYN